MIPIKKIGAGTYGSVYLVDTKHPPDNFRVIKVSSTRFEDMVCSGLVREFACMQSLPPHPNLASLERSWILKDLGYLLMPYYGENLLTKLKRDGPMTANDIVHTVHEAALGLMHMHSHGWLHRDIKPENVFLSSHGTVVGDFSLARYSSEAGEDSCRSEGSSLATTRVCTLWTRPPELVHEHLKAKSHQGTYGAEIDVFSLGATALAMVRGDYVLGKTFVKHEGKEERAYLTGIFNLLGIDNTIRFLYNIPKELLYQSFATAHERLLAFAPRANRDDYIPIVKLITQMLDPVPARRCRLSKVIAETEAMKLSRSPCPTYTLSPSAPNSPTSFPTLIVPPVLVSLPARRMAMCSSFWKEASSIRMPYILACHGLHILRRTDASIPAVILFLKLIQRFACPSYYHASDELIPILPHITLCPIVATTATSALAAGPFLACAYACDLALGKWENEDALAASFAKQEFECIEFSSASTFFEAYSGAWTSQQSVRKSWERLSGV